MSIVTAVRTRHLLSFRYGGRPRVVEPHVYGVNTQGHPALSAFQLRGGSVSGERVGWKMFLVLEMEDVRMLPDPFPGARPDYNPDDTSFSAIYAQL